MTTVRALLFGKAADEVQAIETLAAQMPAQGKAPPLAIAQAVIAKLTTVLDFEISDVLVQAFQVRSALLYAARETFAQPGLVRRVTLQTYMLPWEHRVEFDVRLAGKHLLTLTATLQLELEVTALSAVVQKGLLANLDGGQCRAWASLAVQEFALVTRERLFELAYEMKVGEGIPLIEQARASGRPKT